MNAKPGTFRSIEAEFEYQRTRVRLGLVDEQESIRVGRRDRYEIVDMLGHGAMGTVYLAIDTVLNRKIALKVLTATDVDPSETERRLMREAQALAALNHDNVLSIYDVDVAQSGELFISMEYVPGQTLRAWQTERNLDELLNVYGQVGGGLAAAHEAGIVHRDVKPDNVFIVEVPDGQWRAVVGDFGLAGGDQLRSEARKRAEARGDAPPVSTRGHLGTPAYMAPEQQDASQTNQRSDQYSYCTCIWEAVTGERPFDPNDDPRERPTRPGSMPRWLFRVLRRGLDPEPARRFPDIDELLTKLGAIRRNRRLAPWLALIIAVFSSVVGFVLYPESEAPGPGCEIAGDSIDELWNDRIRAELVAAFTGLEAAKGAGPYAANAIDEAVERWRVAARTQCLSRRDGGGSLDGECLDRWKGLLAKRLDRLTHPTPYLAEHIDKYLETFVYIEDFCETPLAWLDREVADKLDDAENEEYAGELGKALGSADRAIELAATHGQRCTKPEDEARSPEMAAALFRLGHIHGMRDDPAAALEQLERASDQAYTCLDERLLIDIHIFRAQLLALDIGRPTEARAELHEAANLLLSDRHRDQRRRLLEYSKAEGFIELSLGNPAAARAAYGAALTYLDTDQTHEQKNRTIAARLHYDIGITWMEEGDDDAAQQAFERSAALIDPDHPLRGELQAQTALSRAIMAYDREELEVDAELAETFAHGDPTVILKAYTLSIVAAGKRGDFEHEAKLVRRGLAHLDAHPYLPSRSRAALLTASGQVLFESDSEGALKLLRRAQQLWSGGSFVGKAPIQSRLILIGMLAISGEQAEARAMLVALYAEGADTQFPDLGERMAELSRDLGDGNGPADPND